VGTAEAGEALPIYFKTSDIRETAVTLAKHGKGSQHHESDGKTPQQRHRVMRWAQRLKRVFNIDVSTCEKCGGEAKIIAIIEDQAVTDKILHHLQAKGTLVQPSKLLAAARALPE
jgi:hypothetical protein